LGASHPYNPPHGRGGGGISFEVGSVSKVMLSYSQRARVAVAKIKLKTMLKTCEVPSDKIKENKRKGKLFMMKIFPKLLTKMYGGRIQKISGI
jgi:hypothetical protein